MVMGTHMSSLSLSFHTGKWEAKYMLAFVGLPLCSTPRSPEPRVINWRQVYSSHFPDRLAEGS